jgi:hypothetical protein
MKYLLIILLLIVSNTTYAQNVWIPYQPTIQTYPIVPIQPIFIQPQPVIIYNYPTYIPIPTITYQPIFIQKRFLCYHRSYLVNEPVLRWVYQPIYR